MAMKDAVLFLAVSRDSEMLASGSQSGQIKVTKALGGVYYGSNFPPSHADLENCDGQVRAYV